MTLADAIIPAATALVGGGGVWAYLTQIADRRVKREDSEIERLRKDIQQIREVSEQRAREIESLQSRIEVIEHHHSSHLARWIKDDRRRIVWFNERALLTIFAPLGLDREQVEGHSFAELFDAGVAREIDALDRIALTQPHSATSNLIQFHPDLPLMHVVKVAAIGREGRLAYEGYAYSVNDSGLTDAEGVKRQRDQRAVSADRMVPDGPEGSAP